MISPNKLAEIVVKTITGREPQSFGIVNINNKCLFARGDLSFRIELDHWRGYVDTEADWFKKSENILHYFMHRLALTSPYLTLNDDKINYKLLQILKSYIINEVCEICNDSNLHEQLTLDFSNNFVLINFRRSIVSGAAIKKVIHQNVQYGMKQRCKKHFKLRVNIDDESEITNLRLNLLHKVSSNLLKFQNCEVHSEDLRSNNYVFTVKSENNIDESYSRYLCGVALNTNKKKECSWSHEMYLQKKIEKIKALNCPKSFSTNFDVNSFDKNVKAIAKASIIYELLSVKHSSPVIIEKSDKMDICIKEAAFILYNNVRINAILDKYMKSVFEEDFPEIIPIEMIESFNDIIDDESWSLIYNYIIKYPDVLESAVKVEPKLDINIHLLWSFVSNLCHDFSKYYRKNKILMRRKDGNDQTIIITTERLHLLKALQIVLSNSLSLLDIEQLKYM